jgi:predicted PurR-regulated permease PerM
MTPPNLWGLAVRIVALIPVVLAAVWLIVELHILILQLFLALVLATGLARLTDGLQGYGFRKWAAVVVVYLGVILAIVIAVLVVVPTIFDAGEGLVQEAPRYGEMAVQTLRALQERFPALPALDEELTAIIRRLSTEFGLIMGQVLAVARFALGVFRSFIAMVLVLAVSLYLILDREKIRDYLFGFVPVAQRTHTSALVGRMASRTGGWFLGQILLMTIVGLMTFAGLSLIGVPFAVLLALLAALGEIVPIVGPIVTSIPAILMASTQSVFHGVATLLLYVVVQQTESYLLTPKIMGSAVKIHPLAVLIAVLFGTELFGILGALASVPFAAAASILLDELRTSSSAEPSKTGETAETTEPSETTADPSASTLPVPVHIPVKGKQTGA